MGVRARGGDKAIRRRDGSEVTGRSKTAGRECGAGAAKKLSGGGGAAGVGCARGDRVRRPKFSELHPVFMDFRGVEDTNTSDGSLWITCCVIHRN